MLVLPCKLTLEELRDNSVAEALVNFSADPMSGEREYPQRLVLQLLSKLYMQNRLTRIHASDHEHMVGSFRWI